MTRSFAIKTVFLWLSMIFPFFSLVSAEAAAPQLKALGKLHTPRGVAAGLGLDNAGNLFLAESGRRTISKYDTFGRKLKSFSALPVGTGGIAVSPLGDFIYLADDQQIVILNGDSGEIAGRLTPLDGSFRQVAAFDTDLRGNVFVADGGAGRVSVFNAQGEHLADLAAPYDMPRFGKLRALAVNPAGQELWVVEESEGGVRTLVFGLDGVFLRELSSNDFGPESLASVCAIAFDAQGRVYLLDAKRKEVRSFDFKTMQVASFEGRDFSGKKPPGGAADMVFDPVTNRLYVSCGADVFILGVDSRERLQPLVWQ